MDELTQSILAEASSEVEKTANDKDGAPSQSDKKEDTQVDVVSAATELLKGIEQFKQSLSGQVASQSQETQPDNSQEPQQGQVEQPATQQTTPVEAGGTVIQTPGGSIIKLAAFVFAKNLEGDK